MAHDVFVSYSSQDKPTADAIVASLEANGIRCWIAPRDIMPGTDWGEAIVEAIEQAGTMVLVFSAHSNTSPQIRREIEGAVSAGIPLIPFRIEEVLPCKSLQYFIGPQHWLDAWTPPLEQHLHRLTETIKALLSKRIEGFDAAGKEPRLKPQTDTAVEAPTPAAAEPPPTAARAETQVKTGPSPPAKSSSIWVASLVGLLAVLVVAGGIWWRWSQPVATTPKVHAPVPPASGPPVTPTPSAPAPPVTPAPPVAPQPVPQRGKIGLQVQNLTPELAKSFGMAEPKGALVASVDPGFPAEKAGIQSGDIIIEFNWHPIKEMKELPRMVAQISPGSKVALKVLRGGKEMTFNLTIAEITEDRRPQGKEEGKGEETLLGLDVKNLDDNLARQFRLQSEKGAVVVQVKSGSQAAKAGLRAGDLILKIGSQTISDAKGYRAAVANLKKETYARFLIKRQGRTFYSTVFVPR
jgi:hypothetical protein